MTERERLIELLHQANYGAYNHTLEDTHTDRAIEEIADYLLENGVIVPPDELYTIVDKGTYFEDIRPVRVDYLPLYAIKNSIKNGYYFTKEEAEKALKEKA